MEMKDISVSLDELLVDPNNYRLDDGESTNAERDENIRSLQKETLGKLKFQRIGELKSSILKHGFLEMDRIVVREIEDFSPSNKFYVVVEGNRRTAALKNLMNMYQEGEDIPFDLAIKLKSINVICLKGTKEEIRSFSSTLMGIRHVSGPKQWDGYQSAKLINDEYNSGRSFAEIGELLGISSKDAGRRYRGYKAFEQMVSEGYLPKKNYYGLLLEFLAPNKEGREWLGWQDKSMSFEDKKNRDILYVAIAGSETKEIQIKNPESARNFLKCLESQSHKEKLESGMLLQDVMLIPFGSKTDDNHKLDLQKSFEYFKALNIKKLKSDEIHILRKIADFISAGLSKNGK